MVARRRVLRHHLERQRGRAGPGSASSAARLKGATTANPGGATIAPADLSRSIARSASGLYRRDGRGGSGFLGMAIPQGCLAIRFADLASRYPKPTGNAARQYVVNQKTGVMPIMNAIYNP
jgi:hypothetical protein